MENKAVHNTINYVEIGAKDIPALKDFYSATFGWEFKDFGPEYTAFSNSGLEGGFTTTAEVSKGPLVILYSQDLDETEKTVIANGGTISTPTFEFPGGKRFHFLDPSGNELAVWTHTESDV